MAYNSEMNDLTKKRILLAIVVLMFIGTFFLKPISQNLAYHNFADQRNFWGIPNFFDVMSNLPFIFVGLFGALKVMEYQPKVAKTSWLIFFIGVALVGPGSAYYHWNPNNQTLVWDRLPMTVGFMGMFTALISTYINPKIEKVLLPVSLIFGFGSVILWHFTDDLRVYFFVQFMPLALIPLILIMFKTEYIKPKYLISALGFYVIAKIVEILDKNIFEGDGHLLSGHSIKHLSAAVAPYLIIVMLKKIYSKGLVQGTINH
jgi:hypothetical protein